MATGFLRRQFDGNFSLFLKFSMFSLLAVGCGSRPDSSVYDTPVTIEPLIVAMGGYNTCRDENPAILERGPRGMNLYRPFMQLSNLLKDKFGIQARYVISCFESGTSAIFRSSDAPDELKTVETKEFPKLVTKVMRRGSPVYLIGHSHGGWLSLQTTLELAEEITIDGLFSADPISRVHCKPPAIHGCMGFPADIDTNKQIAVKGATGYWLNGWQTNTFYLHSGPSKQADENMKINTSHASLGTHADFWNKVNAKITENL